MPNYPYIIRDESLRQRVLTLISQLDLAKPWAVTIMPYRKNRSLEQNRLYWMWVGLIAGETGNDRHDVHATLMRTFLEPRICADIMTGEVIEEYSTRHLDVGAFSDYLNQIHPWAATTLGIRLPLPEEMHLEGMT